MERINTYQPINNCSGIEEINNKIEIKNEIVDTDDQVDDHNLLTKDNNENKWGYTEKIELVEVKCENLVDNMKKEINEELIIKEEPCNPATDSEGSYLEMEQEHTGNIHVHSPREKEDISIPLSSKVTHENGSRKNNNCDNEKKKYKVQCFVPMCPSNNTIFPNKIFLTAPKKIEIRRKWIEAAQIEPKNAPSPYSVIRCCADHFDLENDVENWIRYKLIGGKIFLKKNVVPRYFDCQRIKSKLRKRTNCETLCRRKELKTPSPQFVAVSMDFDYNMQEIIEESVRSSDNCVQATIYSNTKNK